MSGSLTYRISQSLAAVVVMVGLFGCRSQQPISTNEVRDSVYIERWQYDTIIPDTSYIVTLIECDSLTNLPIIQLEDVYVDDLKLWVEQQANNKFKFNILKPQGVVKVIEKSNSSDKIEVVEIERKRGKFELFLLSSGVVAWLIIIGYLIIKIYKLIKF